MNNLQREEFKEQTLKTITKDWNGYMMLFPIPWLKRTNLVVYAQDILKLGCLELDEKKLLDLIESLIVELEPKSIE